LIDFGSKPPSSKLPLGLCEGDCDSDNDCGAGSYCFIRSEYEAVPGCSGRGKYDYDYCYVKFLTDFGNTPPASKLPLGLCEGDCDSDDDCGAGFICSMRSEYEAVPGCSGRGKYDYDYCSIPRLTDFGNTPPSSKLPLGLCEGDCDSDNDCGAGFICSMRGKYEAVPGCSGRGKGDYDYCSIPLLTDFGDTPPSSKLPLGLCEGDCDSDNDCGAGSYCFERNEYEAVPGCSGRGKYDYDYCSIPRLTDFGNTPPSSKLPLGLCEGDCDSDNDCGAGFTCSMRNEYETVPGCSGRGKYDYDYCSITISSMVPSAAPTENINTCDHKSKSACKKLKDSCVFGKNKIWGPCKPKNSSSIHNCANYDDEESCTDVDNHGGLCKFNNDVCSHVCDDLNQNYCKKLRNTCKLTKVRNPCKGCQHKTTCG